MPLTILFANLLCLSTYITPSNFRVIVSQHFQCTAANWREVKTICYFLYPTCDQTVGTIFGCENYRIAGRSISQRMSFCLLDDGTLNIFISIRSHGMMEILMGGRIFGCDFCRPFFWWCCFCWALLQPCWCQCLWWGCCQAWATTDIILRFPLLIWSFQPATLEHLCFLKCKCRQDTHCLVEDNAVMHSCDGKICWRHWNPWWLWKLHP